MKIAQIHALIEAVRHMENAGPCLSGSEDRTLWTDEEQRENAGLMAKHGRQVTLAKQAILAELAKKGMTYAPYVIDATR